MCWPAPACCTTVGRLAAIDPTIEVRVEDRYVDDRDIFTAAGLSAGIDIALHLVARLGRGRKGPTGGRFLQYDPPLPV